MVSMKLLKVSGAVGIFGVCLFFNGLSSVVTTALAGSDLPLDKQKTTESVTSERKVNSNDREVIIDILDENPDSIANEAIYSMARAIKDKLRDPESAKFRDVRYKVKDSGAVTQHNVCGYVNSKNGFGGYAGWRAFDYSIYYDVAAFYPEGAMCRR